MHSFLQGNKPVEQLSPCWQPKCETFDNNVSKMFVPPLLYTYCITLDTHERFFNNQECQQLSRMFWRVFILTNNKINLKFPLLLYQTGFSLLGPGKGACMLPLKS